MLLFTVHYLFASPGMTSVISNLRILFNDTFGPIGQPAERHPLFLTPSLQMVIHALEETQRVSIHGKKAGRSILLLRNVNGIFNNIVDTTWLG